MARKIVNNSTATFRANPNGMGNASETIRLNNVKIKGGNRRQVVKSSVGKVATDYNKGKTFGGGTQTKSVYKKGVLVKQKTKNLSAGKVIKQSMKAGGTRARYK